MQLTPRKKKLLAVLFLVLAGLSLLNANWLAPTPTGAPKLIAHRGVYHLYDKTAAVGRDTCTARFIRAPEHEIFENTIKSITMAAGLAGKSQDMVEVDVAPTKDGKMVLFHDWTVDCRTNGKGETRDLTLAQLKALDIGYGYSADGGKTFPLRGKGVGLIPTVEEAIAALPSRPLLFNFKSKDPAEADQLFAILKASGRDSIKLGDAFYGGREAGPVKRMRELMPKNWVFSTKDEMKSCSRDYVLFGWTGIIPKSCRNATLAIPINYQFLFWGWPNRLITRMESVGAKVIVMGPYASGKSNEGLTTPEQLGEIPNSFNGYIWVEDIWGVGPALKR
jgi:glycerophosphoryl diester phosphodiesterase